MMKPSSSRNQRNKGFGVRHALQIGLLIAVCFWLLYQVKHSHDKKLAIEEKRSRLSNKVVESQKEVLDLGRKGVPQREEVGLAHDTEDDEVEKEVVEEEEKDGNKQDEAEEEDVGAVDDEIDEQDHEKGEEEELDGEEEKEIRDGEIDFFEDQEDRDRAAQEAREENYKRDDVADSVHRETQTTEIDGGNEVAGISNEELPENVEKDDLVIQNVIFENSGLSADQNTSDVGNVDNSQVNLKSGVPAMSNLMLNSSETNETISNNSPSNNTSSETSVSNVYPNENTGNADEQKENVDERKNLEVESSNLEEASSNSAAVEPRDQQTDSNSSLMGVAHDSKVENQSSTIQLDMVTHEPRQNETVRLGTAEDHNSTVILESKESDTPKEDTSVDSTDTGLGVQENSNFSASDEVTGTAHGDARVSSHHMVTEEEKEARTDLSTLPDTHDDPANIDDEPIE